MSDTIFLVSETILLVESMNLYKIQVHICSLVLLLQSNSYSYLMQHLVLVILCTLF